MKIERLVKLLRKLQGGKKLTALSLANSLNVSSRTILRDVKFICSLNIPLVSMQGEAGGIAFEEGFDTVKFSDEELHDILKGKKSIVKSKKTAKKGALLVVVSHEGSGGKVEKLYFSSLDEAVSKLLSIGPKITVLEPAQVITKLKKEAKKIYRKYKK